MSSSEPMLRGFKVDTVSTELHGIERPTANRWKRSLAAISRNEQLEALHLRGRRTKVLPSLSMQTVVVR